MGKLLVNFGSFCCVCIGISVVAHTGEQFDDHIDDLLQEFNKLLDVAVIVVLGNHIRLHLAYVYYERISSLHYHSIQPC